MVAAPPAVEKRRTAPGPASEGAPRKTASRDSATEVPAARISLSAAGENSVVCVHSPSPARSKM